MKQVSRTEILAATKKAVEKHARDHGKSAEETKMLIESVPLVLWFALDSKSVVEDAEFERVDRFETSVRRGTFR